MELQATKFMLMARDMERALAFYRGVLGLSPTLESPHWSELRLPGVQGAVTVALHGGGSGARTKTGLSFQVADLEAACAEVAAGGGQVVSPPSARPGEPVKLAECADPEGNVFMLTEYLG